MANIYYKTPVIRPTSDNDINGIFDFFLNKSIDPTKTFLAVKTSGNWSDFDPLSVITWKYNEGKWASENEINSYLAFSFSPNIIKLTHFSFKGLKENGFATKFDLYGSQHFDNWIKIQSFESGEYCGKMLNSENKHVCANDNVITWKLDSPALYTAFKWVITEGSDEPGIADFLSMQGIDLFGQMNPFFFSSYSNSRFIFEFPT